MVETYLSVFFYFYLGEEVDCNRKNRTCEKGEVRPVSGLLVTPTRREDNPSRGGWLNSGLRPRKRGGHHQKIERVASYRGGSRVESP